MSGFKIGATIDTSINVVGKNWETYFSINKKPIIGIFLLHICEAIASYMTNGEVSTITAFLNPTWDVTPYFILGYVLYGFLQIVINLNWHALILLGAGSPGEALSSVPIQPAMWMTKFKPYLVKSLGLVLIGAGIYGLIWIGSVQLFKQQVPISILIILGVTCAILVAPFLARLNIILPMIAAGDHTAGFMSVLTLTHGLGWRIFVTEAGSACLVVLIMLLIFIPIVLVGSLLSLLLLLMTPDAEAIVTFLNIFIQVPFNLLALAVGLAVPALIFAQLKPEFLPRWEEVSFKDKTKVADESDEADSSKSLDYGKSKHR